MLGIPKTDVFKPIKDDIDNPFWGQQLDKSII